MTLEKIGEKLGITKERVRRLNVKAMEKPRPIAEQKACQLKFCLRSS
jgi:DNA-directed RNA polymerase sigma subunit (sigma70/sigma32)